MLYENSGDSTPPLFSQDECEGLDEDECKAIKEAIDITAVMADLGCTTEDMEEVMEEIPGLVDGEKSIVEHVCRNGNAVRIEVLGDGSIRVDTRPPYMGDGWDLGGDS